MNRIVSAQINSKLHPPSLNKVKKEDVGEKEYLILLKHFLWSWFRKCNSFDQIHPAFPGEFCYLNAYLYSAFSGVFFSSFFYHIHVVSALPNYCYSTPKKKKNYKNKRKEMGKLKNTKYEMLFLIFYSFIFGGLTFFH